ncbi:uncharacterized protein UMAG_03032 [Mycosarcoma maydis]|uniref:Uncharacterized protein n=1 Tax=Mycosarcoma maydis TaxID=5270 RepID=A0A0D1CR71_MYCMD|nr:uncharacterized protein UMAG_03032 [Ustilago maydis 521]KIS69053.1 hypothetical protein UMAG_03032 [Ustilago maydis 521]|eukprot:XP_011389407.1 hypothetical protein UMAG_03032 [Ustilago maydis 521]
MASPTAIPHPEKSAHYRPRSTCIAPADLSSEIRTSEGQRLSFSPPISFYSRSSAQSSVNALRIPVGMASTMGPPSPTDRFSKGFSPINPKLDDSRMSPPHVHARARSQTTIGSGTIASSIESWDANRVEPRAMSDATGSQPSSYISASDLSFSRSPTSPGSSLSSSGYSLGRVPSLPLGASYEQAQKRFNSGSWGQKMGWMNTMRPGPLSPALSRTSIDEGSAATDGAGNGAVGNLLRRFSLGGSSYRANNGAISSSAAAPVAPVFDSAPPASPQAIPAMRDSGVCLDEAKPVARGRQASFGGSAKRKPSPMGERLLMGHFNAH